MFCVADTNLEQKNLDVCSQAGHPHPQVRVVILCSSQDQSPPRRALGGCFKEGSDAPLCFSFPLMRWVPGHSLAVPQSLLLCLYTALGAEIMGLIQSQLQSNHKSFLCLQWGLDQAQSS